MHEPGRSAAEPPSGLRPAVDVSTPFGRLALAHVLSLAGDALVAMALAGSLFFDVDPAGARWRIALYLAFTMAPFAVVGPLIGPAMDRARGGHRVMLVGSAIGRSVVAFLMISSAGSDSLLLFPEAFLMLVLSKSYQVAKAAIVPTVVDSDAGLVEANSKLQLLSGLSGFAAGVPGAVLLLVGPEAVMTLATIVFAGAIVAALRVPATTVASEPAGTAERAEMRSAGVLSAASAMGTLRAVVGLVTFLLAFALRGDTGEVDLGTGMGRLARDELVDGGLSAGEMVARAGPPAWHFGVIVALSVGGGLLGAAVAPVVRRHLREELLLLGAMGAAAAAGGFGMLVPGLVGQAILALGVAVAASSGKQAFDAVVQRDAPDANRGRSFARFESRFQVAWVLGAFVPVVVPLPTRVGSLFVLVLALAAGSLFLAAMVALGRGRTPPRLPTTKEVGRRLSRTIGERRARSGTGAPQDSRSHEVGGELADGAEGTQGRSPFEP